MIYMSVAWRGDGGGNVIRAETAVEHKHAASDRTYGSINGLHHKHNNILHPFRWPCRYLLVPYFFGHFNTGFIITLNRP